MSTSSHDHSGESHAIVINGARYSVGPHTAVHASLLVRGGRVERILRKSRSLRASPCEIDLNGWLLLPGLINAHDHLQYALHPRLGRPPYNNYVEWGDDIHVRMNDVISHHNSIAKESRLWWGGIRNLLCGVTTVCHHDPFWPTLKSPGYPIKVLSNYRWMHSVRLVRRGSDACSEAGADCPLFVHACEGTDKLAQGEIAELDLLGVLNEKTVVVHGLAMDEDGIGLLVQRGSSVVLCLSSNQFLYNYLPDLERLKQIEKIALGNDSPLSAAGDLLDEVRFVIAELAMPTDRAYRMVTDLPATISCLSEGQGCIREAGCADLVAVRDNGDPPHRGFAMLSWRDVEFVMIAGEVRLASHDVWCRLPQVVADGMESIWIDGCVRWIRAPVRTLMEEAESVLGTGMVRLGGRAVRIMDSCNFNVSIGRTSGESQIEERL